MNSQTPHTQRKARQGYATTPHVPSANPEQVEHPDRAAVKAHLKHLHDMVSNPSMKGQPLQPSEGTMLAEGASQVMRAANTVGS